MYTPIEQPTGRLMKQHRLVTTVRSHTVEGRFKQAFAFYLQPYTEDVFVSLEVDRRGEDRTGGEEKMDEGGEEKEARAGTRS